MSKPETGNQSSDSAMNPHLMINEMKRLLKHSAVYGMGNILSKIAGFILIPVYTNYLIPSEYGVMELLDLTLFFVSLFVGQGLSSAVLRFYFDTKDKDQRNTIVSTAILFVCGLSVVVVVFSLLFDDQICLFLFKTKSMTAFFDLMIITFFFSGLIEIPLVLLRAQERSVAFTVITLLRLLLALSLNIYFIVVVEWGVKGFLVSQLTTSVIVSLVLVVTTLGKSPITFSLSHLKTMVLFSLPLLPSAVGMFWINFGDRFFLKQWFTDWDVGIYALGYRFAMMLSILVGQPFFLIWSTRHYEVIEMENGEKLYARFGTYLAVAITFAALGISLVIQDVMEIISSEKYRGGHVVVPFIVLGYALREMSDFFRGILYIAKRPTYIGIAVSITALVATLLYLILIPQFKLLGAALATLITFAFLAGIMLYFAQKVKPLPYEFRRMGVVLFSALGFYLVFSPWRIEPVWADFLLKAGVTLFYVPMLYLLGFFTEREMEKIKNLWGKSLEFIRMARAKQ